MTNQTPESSPKPELRCSECGQMFDAPSCGLVHAITWRNMIAIRHILKPLINGL